MSRGPRLRGKVMLVTGASAGIGRDTAARLIRRGAHVVGAARDEERLRQVDGLEAVRCDVARSEERAALVEGVLARHGRIDALVNNAGLGWQGRVEEMSPEWVQYLFDVNVVGLIDLSRRVLPSMLERRSGDIVNVSSLAGYVTVPLYSAYSATKFAVNGFTIGLRREVWGRGVRVHLVTPGLVRTEWMPRSSGYQPDPGAPEARTAGISATHVARAIERCLKRPWSRTASVPRVLGVSRVSSLPPLRQAGDGLLAAANRLARGSSTGG